LEFFARDRVQAERLLRRSFQPEIGIYAVDGSNLSGMIGLEHAGGPRFLNISFQILREEFGGPAALWRWAWLAISHLYQRPRRGEMRIEGLVVAEAARGKGIGTSLIEQACAYAGRQGCSALTLEVVDTNPRARRLYERLGFQLRKEEHYGALTARAGLGGAAFMFKKI
jgi:ribosomal protein S18 acetylase RimI-like enzyme